MKTIATVLMILAACGDNGKPLPEMTPDAPDQTPAGPARAVVVAGDFITPGFSGVMSKLELSSMTMTQNVAPAGSVGNDPVVRKIGNELFVVNRGGGNSITVFDAATLAVKTQLATGASSNPQDVATFGLLVFVPAMGTAGVVLIDRGVTPPATKTIDLSALDPDGLPDCVSAIRNGNTIYVACGVLDGNFQPRGNGIVVLIDGPTLAIKDSFELSTSNPFGVFTELPDNGGLVIPTFDFGAPLSKCLELVATGSNPGSKGCLVKNTEIGGYVVKAQAQQLESSTMLWMIVNNGNFAAEKARLWGYDVTSKLLWDAPITPETQVLTDIAVCPDEHIVVSDKTMAANGLRVYEGTTEKTTEPLAVGLRPQSSPAIVCY